MPYVISALIVIALFMIFVRRPWHLVVSGLCGLASSCLGLVVVIQHTDRYEFLAIPMLPAGIFATVMAAALCSLLATSQTHVSGAEVAGEPFDATRA